MALLSLAEAKDQLNITGDANDAVLEAYIAGVTTAIEAHVGPVEARTVRETHETPTYGARVLVLTQSPVISLTSVTPVLTAGTEYAVSSLALDSTTGAVQRLDGGRLYGPLSVLYIAGRSEVPPTINLAARLMLQHLWRTRRGSARGPVIAGGDDYDVNEPVAGWGYAIPNRVLELLASYKLPPAVA